MTFARFIASLLVLNLIAISAYLVVVTNDPQPASKGSPSAQETPVVTNVVVVTNQVAAASDGSFHWSMLESEDYSTYIQNLRDIGCPEQTIRDIIIADLDLLWAPRLRSAVPRQGPWRYWESAEAERRNDYDARAWERLQRAIRREKRDVVRALVQVDLTGERARLQGEVDPLAQRLPLLDSEKRMDLRDVLDRFQDEEQAILERIHSEGVTLDEQDKAQLRELRAQREAELESLLSPEEKRRYELSMSQTAEDLRHDMYDMKATEEEFLAIFDVRREFEKMWDPELIDLSDPNEAARWEEARVLTEEAIQKALGPERYQEYQRGQDEDYHLLNRAAVRYGLDPQVANEVYGYKQMLAAQREMVIMDPELSPNQVEAVLQAMNEEAQEAIQQRLGPNAYHYIRRQSSWMHGR